MAPNLGCITQENEPVSRTYQYRKVMKPMLERKRRARINRCLDELKELMTGALQANEGENVTKLEKADILELTVRHLHTLRQQNKLHVRPEASYADRFRAGFSHCATEVSQFLNNVDQSANVHLMRHLSECIHRLEGVQQQQQQQLMSSQMEQHQQMTSSPPPSAQPSNSLPPPPPPPSSANGAQQLQPNGRVSGQPFYHYPAGPIGNPTDMKKPQELTIYRRQQQPPQHFQYQQQHRQQHHPQLKVLNPNSIQMDTSIILPKTEHQDSPVWRPWG